MRYLTNILARMVIARLNYWLGVLVDAVLAGGFLVHAVRTMHGTWITAVLNLLAGFVLYGVVEYGVHRWAYHDDRSPATPGHRLHHDDPEALIAAPFFGPAIVVLILWGLLRFLLGDEEASVLIVALVISFLYYELLHHGLHHWRHPARYLRILRGHHRIHHQFPDCNFGVTMTVWDWVFGTHYLMVKRRGVTRGVSPTP
jgi:dihydroceramide fatty acyl 2-hydroxylase